MNNVDMLELLMYHNIDLVCNDTNRTMAADCFYELDGEFTVYYHSKEIWRGDDFELALAWLEGREDEQ